MPRGIYERTEEILKKQSLAMLGKHHKCSEETKEKMRKAKLGNRGCLGCKRSEEFKRRLSLVMTGRKHSYQHECSEETREKLRKALFGKHHTKETKEKLSKFRKGKKRGPCSEATKKKMSDSRYQGMANGTIKPRYRGTDIEAAIEAELLKQNFMVQLQAPIKGVGSVDFYLPEHNIIIECDGDYYHTLPGAKERDARKTLKATKLGYKVFRFWGTDIKQDVSACVRQLQV